MIYTSRNKIIELQNKIESLTIKMLKLQIDEAAIEYDYHAKKIESRGGIPRKEKIVIQNHNTIKELELEYRRILQMSWRLYINFATSDAMTRTNNDIEMIDEATQKKTNKINFHESLATHGTEEEIEKISANLISGVMKIGIDGRLYERDVHGGHDIYRTIKDYRMWKKFREDNTDSCGNIIRA